MAEQKPNPGKTTTGVLSGGRRVSFIARHEWTVVGLLAVLAFVLGCIGYAQTMIFASAGGDHTWWDVIYASLQLFIFEGPEARASREEIPPYPMPLNRRLGALVYAHYSSTSEVTQTEKDNYEILKVELQPVLDKLNSVHEDIKDLNEKLDDIGAPWTPGRIPALKY